MYARDGIRLVPVPAASGPELRGSHAVKTSYNVYQWLRTREFDVVHFHEWRGIAYYALAARAQGICLQRSLVCVGVHSPSLWHKEGMHEPVSSVDDLEIDFMERESAARADVVWFPSRHMARWVQDQGWRLPSRRIVRQYVVSDGRAPGADRSARPVSELCFFGRLETRKGLDVFCDALDVLSDRSALPSSVTFLGKVATVHAIDSRQYISSRASRWPFTVKVVTDLDRDTALAYLAGPARLAVLPSRVDNLPLTVLECLWAGIPFVSTAIGGIPEMLAQADRDEMLCPLRGDALAGLLARALTDGARPGSFAVAPRTTERAWIKWHAQLAGRSARQLPARRRRLPLVSVCLIHRNRPTMLAQALQSLLRQDYPRVEVVLVDDGSDTPEAIRAVGEAERVLAKGRVRGRVLRQPRRFPAAARNAASRVARGEYLLFMDDDNIAKPGEISTLVERSLHSRADILTCFLDVFRGDAAPEREDEALFRWSFLGGATAVGAFRNAFGDTNCLVKRRVYLALGGMTEDTIVGAEDWEFLARAALAGYRMEVLPDAPVWYRQSPAGVNSTTPPTANHLRALRPYRTALGQGLSNMVQLCARPAQTDAAPARPLAADHIRDVVIFGSGQGGQRAMELAQRCSWRVAYMVDNNESAWNTRPHGVDVKAPAALQNRDFDLVVIASVAGRHALSSQLDGIGLAYGSSYAFFLDTFSIGKVQVALSL